MEGMLLKKNKLLIPIITTFVVVCGMIYSGFREEIVYLSDAKEYSFGSVKVHVSGAVANSGLYVLDYNSRVEDAIKMAGGVTEYADVSYINKADFVMDGDKIYVPHINESLDEIYLKSGKALDKLNVPDYVINVNKDSIYKLVLLPGIGEKTAEKIIAYRDSKGKFTRIEDLLNVSGIGRATLDEVRDYITLE